MSRQSQVNSFNDGMNKDLNPLLTPSTVMTDCLNGTIVTYNGNEFALQNDLGNYKFKSGSLDDGFVPVGIKEYANTLYIVSYNPISDEVEIGSFPSMKTINTSEINNSNESSELNLGDGEYILYSELSNQSSLTMISELKDDYKINPGDKYILEKYEIDDNGVELSHGEINKISDRNKFWQHVSTYILTENNKLYNIDNLIDCKAGNGGAYINKDFQDVSWDVPGYMAIKVIPNVMDEFNCYVTDFGAESENIQIKVQSIWGSFYDDDEIKDYIKNNLVYAYKFYDESFDENGNSIIEIKDLFESYKDESLENNLQEYNDLYFSIHGNIKYSKFENNASYVKIVPILRVNVSTTTDPVYKYIIYDQFETILSLNKISFDITSIRVGVDRSNYIVDDKNVTIDIDINSSPDISSSFKFERLINAEGNQWDVALIHKTEETNYNGQNIFKIPFSTDEEPGFFDKEDKYKMTMYIYPIGYNANLDDESNFVWKKTSDVYLSEIVNDYSKNNAITFSFEDIKPESVITDKLFSSFAKGHIGINDFTVSEEGTKYYNIDNNIDSIFNQEEMLSNIKELVENWKLKRWEETNSDHIKTSTINYGTKYKINLNENLIKLPLNQYGEIGKLWDSANVENIKISSDNFLISNIDNEFWIKLNTSNTISSDYRNAGSYSYSISNIDIEGTESVKIEDEWYELKFLRFFHKSHEHSGGDKRKCDYGKIPPKYKTFFKPVSANEILLKINYINSNNEIEVRDYKFIKNAIWEVEALGDHNNLTTEWILEFAWENNEEKYDITGYEDNVSLRMNGDISRPELVLFYNNISTNNTIFFRREHGQTEGFAYPKLYNEDDENENRIFLSLASPKDSAKDLFTIITPGNDSIKDYYNTDYSNPVPAWSYIINVFATYFLIVDSIKYCNDVASKEMDKLNDISSNEDFIGDSKTISNVDYDIKIKFTGINHEYYNDIFNNLNLETYTYNSVLENSISLKNDVTSQKSEIIDILTSIYSNIPDVDIKNVNAQTHYVDEKYWNEPHNLENIVSKFVNGKPFQLISNPEDPHLQVKCKSNAGWYNNCYIYNSTYEI